MVEFLEEGEPIKMMESVYKISFLFIDNVVSGANVFELVVCLVGSIQGQEGAERLAVSEDRDF